MLHCSVCPLFYGKGTVDQLIGDPLFGSGMSDDLK